MSDIINIEAEEQEPGPNVIITVAAPVPGPSITVEEPEVPIIHITVDPSGAQLALDALAAIQAIIDALPNPLIADVVGLQTALDALATAISTLSDDVESTLLLKEDKDQKGVANGYAPLDAAIKIASTYLYIINDLTTGGATALLSAEQGKQLKLQINAINTLLTSDNVNLDTVQEIVDAIETVQLSLSTILIDDLTTGGSTKALTAQQGVVLKGLIDALTIVVSGKQNALNPGSNITIVGNTINATSDMVLASAQTVSGLKTFLSGMLGLRNVANTFTSFITNANTAVRTYVLQNRNGTLLDDTDYGVLNGAIATKQNLFSGIANYLPKSSSSTALTPSRISDDGACIGIGSVSPIAMTKDIQLGRQANKEIGIEQSDSTTAGKSLKISAGRTINFAEVVGFASTGAPVLAWSGIAASSSGNIWARITNGNFYKNTGSGFVDTGVNSLNGQGMGASYTGNNMYAAVWSADIYKNTNDAGWVGLGFGNKSYSDVTVAPNGDVYVCTYTQGIWKQTGGAGALVDLLQVARNYFGIAAAPNGDVYATVNGGDIYKQTGGTGNFVALSQTSRSWLEIACAPNGDVWTVADGNIYKQTGGTGNFILQSVTSRSYYGITVAPNGDVYVSVSGGTIYRLPNDATGTVNLDGGTLIHEAGTGKGTGQSRIQGYTGQKTTSGTDMQVSTLRYEVNELGRFEVFGQIKLKSYTVATLPTGSVGEKAVVTDALAPTYMTAVVGGGSVVTPVFHNGTAWVAN